jgi:hypothetical protein
MKEVGAQLEVTLQSRGLSEVPPKIAAANKQFSMEARMRKIEAGGRGTPPDKPPPDKTSSAASGPPRSGGRGRRGRGRSGRAGGQEPTAPTGKCFTCGKVGCKPSTCPNGNPDAQKEHAAKQAERARANANRQVCLLQGTCNVSDDEAVSHEEKAQACLLSRTVCYDLSQQDYGWGVRVRRHLAHAGGVLYGMELGSVTLKNKHSTHTRTPSIHAPRVDSIRGNNCTYL